MPSPIHDAEQRDEWAIRRRRAALVEHLRGRGIADERVLAAIGRVPRHRFLPDTALRPRAYHDEALPIGLGQTISQPYTVAVQTALLDVQPGDRVLEIGTGSGYQAAVLAELGARVASIERHAPLLERTAPLLAELGYDVRTKAADGALGWPSAGPFDGIVVTAGALGVPPALLAQLRLPSLRRRGGVLVIPVGAPGEAQTMRRLTRTGPDAYADEAFEGFRFVPFVSREAGGHPG